MNRRAGTTRGRRDDGAAMVEFAFIGVLLFFLLFGIINFGVLLSVRNSITQSANEGARSAVGVFARNGLAYAEMYGSPPPQSKILAEEAAISRMRERLSHLEGDVNGPIETRCSDPGQCPPVTEDPAITYTARVHDCIVTDEATLQNFAATVDSDADTNDCIFTEVIYHHERYRLLPPMPLITSVTPDRIADTADVALT